MVPEGASLLVTGVGLMDVKDGLIVVTTVAPLVTTFEVMVNMCWVSVEKDKRTGYLYSNSLRNHRVNYRLRRESRRIGYRGGLSLSDCRGSRECIEGVGRILGIIVVG